jgi:thioredoxin reductase (NADPH)
MGITFPDAPFAPELLMADDPTPTPTPPLAESRRHQMFPVLSAAEIARIHRFGTVLHFKKATGCSPPANPAPACL